MSDDAKWVTAQKKTFTKWFNNHLRKKGYPALEDIKNDWSTGIRLMQVVNSLYDVPMPRKYNKKPRMRPHKLDNLTIAMKMLTEKAEVKTNFLKNTHLLDGDEKMILGMMWSIILHYAINGINVDEMTAKEGLLLWVQKKTKGYNGVDPPKVRNFHRDWRSGLAFCALIHRHHPNELDYDSLDHKDNAGNLALAFDAAERLGIPRLLDVEDVDVDKPDERSVMTYVSEFFHAFASANQTEAAVRRAKKFLDFARAIFNMQNEYETRAAALLAWIEDSQAKFSEYQPGETLDEAKDALNYFRDYVVNEKPPKLGEFFDLMALLAEIQTDLKVNGRPEYSPPDELSPQTIDAAFEALIKTENSYSETGRAHRFTFVSRIESGLSEEQLAEFQASFNHFDANANGLLSPAEFRAALVAVNVAYRDDADFMRVFNKNSEEDEKGERNVTQQQYIAFMTALAADKDTPEQVRESFATLAGNPNTINDSQMNYFSEEEKAFIKNRASDDGDGNYDFASFISASYA
jgi:Ca2+-binding EF-hand superfamily protein